MEVVQGTSEEGTIVVLQPDVILNMTLEDMYDYVGIRVKPDWDTDYGDGEFHFMMVASPSSSGTTSGTERHIWTFENQTLTYTDFIPATNDGTEGTINFGKDDMGELICADKKDMSGIIDAKFTIDNSDVKTRFVQFMTSLDFPEYMFNVVLPRPDA